MSLRHYVNETCFPPPKNPLHKLMRAPMKSMRTKACPKIDMNFPKVFLRREVNDELVVQWNCFMLDIVNKVFFSFLWYNDAE